MSQKGIVLKFDRRASGAPLLPEDRARIDKLKAGITGAGFAFAYDPSRGELRVSASARTASRVPAAVGGSLSSRASL